ncbi:hypothetical protein O3P69_003465 [Scylla paramamosain]|uniref:BRO1 domain-containing protein n=1 Tax=Scylla paramamosain TaxID=85552 RepID=A0AAW0UI44_SCYPA
MSHWFHRNPLKATAEVKFDLKMVATDSQALKLCSDLKQARARLLELLPNANHEIDVVEPALTLYLSLLRGLIEVPEGENSDWSKLRHALRYRWSHSMLGTKAEGHYDAIYELVSVLQNTAFWYMKHASKIAAQEEVSMDEAKLVHRSLRRGAGLLKYAQDEWVNKLLESPAPMSDSDPRVHTAYLNQATAEAQEEYEEAGQQCKEYSHTKGPGTQAKPEKHQFFRRLAPIVTRTLEKCERENGMIYHQKIPYDPPELEIKATYGLVAPDDYTLPPMAPLWTPVTYSAFDLTKNLSEDDSSKSKTAQKVEGDLPAVKETEVHHTSKDHKNDSGCSIM